MKKYIIILFLFLGFVSCNNNDTKVPASLVKNPNTADKDSPREKMAAITFEKDEHDFGKIIQGEQVSCIFKFENTGDAPLLISKVNKTCGCTITKFSSDPIDPGKKGQIEVIFDSSGKKGNQNKYLTVMSNTTPSKTTLKIKAVVATPDKY